MVEVLIYNLKGDFFMNYIVSMPEHNPQLTAEAVLLEMLHAESNSIQQVQALAPGESINIGDITVTRPSETEKLPPDALTLLWNEAIAAESKFLYLAQFGTTRIIPGNNLELIHAQLSRIYDSAHMDVKDICRSAGLTQSALAARFGIPKRTVENWCSGVNKCPDYTRRMMCELLGLLNYSET